MSNVSEFLRLYMYLHSRCLLKNSHLKDSAIVVYLIKASIDFDQS